MIPHNHQKEIGAFLRQNPANRSRKFEKIGERNFRFGDLISFQIFINHLDSKNPKQMNLLERVDSHEFGNSQKFHTHFFRRRPHWGNHRLQQFLGKKCLVPPTPDIGGPGRVRFALITGNDGLKKSPSFPLQNPLKPHFGPRPVESPRKFFPHRTDEIKPPRDPVGIFPTNFS
ncbi:MAG: hypothetical protein CM15mP130_1580 [Verrucomicrobiota bacterium]|nr:MAG: hypothetical protein CM15mP130_1580 [Verrucomicrobiota bacterium]